MLKGRAAVSLTQDVQPFCRRFVLRRHDCHQGPLQHFPWSGSPGLARGPAVALARFRWGLVPFWAEAPSSRGSPINARAESLEQTPAFRTLLARRRCLVLADGYYVWVRDGILKQPIRVVRADRRIFAFAGVWYRWIGADSKELLTFAIITAEAPDCLQALQPLAPVVLSDGRCGRWIDPRIVRPEDVRRMLQPCNSRCWEFYPVDAAVNDRKHDSPACIAAVPRKRPSYGPQPGQIVQVHHCAHSYPLPAGLAPGTRVKLVSFQPGTWTVESAGRRSELPMTNVDAGDEIRVAGEWWHERHPIARDEFARPAKWTTGVRKFKRSKLDPNWLGCRMLPDMGGRFTWQRPERRTTRVVPVAQSRSHCLPRAKTGF